LGDGFFIEPILLFKSLQLLHQQEQDEAPELLNQLQPEDTGGKYLQAGKLLT